MLTIIENSSIHDPENTIQLLHVTKYHKGTHTHTHVDTVVSLPLPPASIFSPERRPGSTEQAVTHHVTPPPTHTYTSTPDVGERVHKHILDCLGDIRIEVYGMEFVNILQSWLEVLAKFCGSIF